MNAPAAAPPDLGALPFFADLPDSSLRVLEAGLRRERVQNGQLLSGNGQPADALTIVCHGRLKVSYSGSLLGGAVQDIRPGGWFGADTVLLGPREPYTVVAAEDVHVAKISRACIDDLLRRSFFEALGPAVKETTAPGTGPATDYRVAHSSRRALTASRDPRIGLALSGGGAKAFAHLGVLKVFSEAGIGIDVVAGTSAGAIAGAMFCAGKSIPEMCALADDLRRRVLRREGMWDFLEPPTVGMIRGERTQALYDQILGGADFEQLDKPLAIPAADMVTGEIVVFRSGRISEAIRASAGIPGLFAPWPYAGRYLAEGGLVNPLPIDLARELGADIVIACDVTGGPDEIQGETLEGQNANFLGLIAARASAILDQHARPQASDTEIVIRPEVQDYDVLDYPMADELIELGEAAARTMLSEIRKALGTLRGQWPGTALAVAVSAGQFNA